MTENTLSPEVAAQVAEAAEVQSPAEVKAKTKTVTFRDQSWQIPAKPTVQFMYLLEAERVNHAVEAALGDKQWGRFLALTPAPDTDDIEAFFKACGTAYGVAGN